MDKIEGWKGICAELGVTEKTARKWATIHGLPVRTLIGTVYLMRDALDAWLMANDVLYSERARQSDPGASKAA